MKQASKFTTASLARCLGLSLLLSIALADEVLVPAGDAPAPAFSFVQLCDTQLGKGGYEHDLKSFERAVDRINSLQPDFVLICGDLVQNANDKSFADFKRIKNQFQMPCHCAAGNHDVGNKPTVQSLQKYRETIGPDYYTFTHHGLTFVVANTQLWKAPIAGESEKHDAWFRKTLEQAKAENHPVIVVTHYPFFTKSANEEEHYYNLALAKRKELFALCEVNGVIAVLSGHTHRFTENEHMGIQLVSGETTSVNTDKRPLGFRLWTVEPDAGIKHRFVPIEE